MAELKFFKSILEDSYETFTIKPGMTVEDAVREYGDDEAYTSNLVECYDLDTGKTFFAPLTDDSDFGIVAVVNGKDVSKEYVFEENDSAVIIVTPMSGNNPDGTKSWDWGWAVGGLVVGGLLGMGVGGVIWGVTGLAWGAGVGGAVGFLAGGFVGADIYNKKHAPKDVDGTQRPDIGGAANQPITGNPIPLVLGKKEISPFIIGSPYVEYHGVGGKDAWLHVLYCVGYGPLLISDIKFDCLKVTDNPRKVMRGMLSGAEMDGGDIKTKWNANSPMFEIIQQDTNSNQLYFGSLYPNSKLQENVGATPMFIRDDTLTDDELYDSTTKKLIQYSNSNYDNGFRTNSVRFSQQYTRKLEVAVDIPEGIYFEKNTENGWTDKASIPLYLAVQWRPYSDAASKRERDGEGDAEFRSESNHGYEYSSSRRDGWITFDEMVVDDDVGKKPVTFTEARRSADVKAHSGNTLHKEEEPGSRDYTDAEVIAALKDYEIREKDENYTEKETYLDHLERVFSPYKAECNETYKNWLGKTKPAKVGFKLEFGKKCPSDYKDRFGFAESDHDYMFTESQFDSIVDIVYGTKASAAKKAFMQIPPEDGKRKVTIFCHPYRGSFWSRDYMDNTQDVIHYMQTTYGIYKERKVTRTRTVAYRAHAIDYDINWTRPSPQGPMIIGSITFKNGIKNYNFETKDVYLYLPMTWTSDFAFSKEDYDRIETVYRDGIQYHRLKCNNWPIIDTTKPEQDFCNENWVNCKVFNLQEAQNYVSSKSGDSSSSSGANDKAVTEKFNKSEIRVTFTADIEAFCKKYNEVASDFLYGSDNSTKALEIRVIRISPNYINEISTSSNKYPKTFHDGISWKTLTSETIDIDDINKEFSNKIGKELQKIQDQLNGNVQLSNLNVISYAHLREKDWPFDEDLDATIVPLYAQQYTRMIDGVKHRILATPVGDEEILTPAELESYVDDFAESKNDTKGLIVFYKEDNEVYGETSAISTFINDIFYTVDRYYSGETNDGIDKFIPSRPISNRHYKDACLLSLSVMADNTGNIQGQLEKLSLVAQAFAPKLNGSIWFPENIQKKKKYFLGSKVELKDTRDKTAKEQYEEAIANGDTKAICINGGNNWRQKIDSIIFAKPEDFNPYIGNVLYTYDETKNKSVSSSEMHTYAPGKTVSYLGLTALTPHVYIELTGSDNGQKMYAFLDITGTLIAYTTYKVVKVVTIGDIVINEGSTPDKSGWYLTDESYAVGSEEGIDFGKEDYSQTQISQFCYEGYEGEWSNPGKSVEANKIVYKKVYNTTYQTNHVLFIRTDKDIGENDKLTGTVIEFNPSHENNSAPSQFMLACIGPHLGKDALDYSDINLMSIAEWHSNCIKVIDGSTYPGTTSIAEIFMECNGYVYSKLKLEDLLSKIAVSGRAGYTRGDDGKIIAVMDNIVPYPKGILNNQNALSVTISYSFLPAPSGVLVNFKNADNFGIDEGLMVMNDGEDFRNPTGDVEMQSFDFVTNITQAYSLGRYYLANKEFSRNAINWKAGIEGFDLQYGDVLKVTFDMLLVGQACGRITEIIEKDGKAYGLILSDTYEYDGKPDHAIEVMQTSQYGKDRVIVIPVNNEEVSVEYTDPRDGKTKVFRNPKVGTVNFVSFDEPITLGEEYAVGEKMYFFKPQVENLVNYGFKDKVSRLYRIRSKAPDTNFSFAFSLVPYSERFYDYGCDIPSMNRNITVPSRTSDADISIDNKANLTDVLSKMEETKQQAEENSKETTIQIVESAVNDSKVKEVNVYYAKNSDGQNAPIGYETAPNTTWTTEIPEVLGGQYLWTCTTTVYNDGRKFNSLSSARQGENGVTSGTDKLILNEYVIKKNPNQSYSPSRINAYRLHFEKDGTSGKAPGTFELYVNGYLKETQTTTEDNLETDFDYASYVKDGSVNSVKICMYEVNQTVRMKVFIDQYTFPVVKDGENFTIGLQNSYENYLADKEGNIEETVLETTCYVYKGTDAIDEWSYRITEETRRLARENGFEIETSGKKIKIRALAGNTMPETGTLPIPLFIHTSADVGNLIGSSVVNVIIGSTTKQIVLGNIEPGKESDAFNVYFSWQKTRVNQRIVVSNLPSKHDVILDVKDFPSDAEIGDYLLYAGPEVGDYKMLTVYTWNGFNWVEDDSWEHIMACMDDSIAYLDQNGAENSKFYNYYSKLFVKDLVAQRIGTKHLTLSEGGEIDSAAKTKVIVGGKEKEVSKFSITADGHARFEDAEIKGIVNAIGGKFQNVEISGYITVGNLEETKTSIESDIEKKGTEITEAIEQKGYQTADDVDGLITDKGYQTADDVDSAITNKDLSDNQSFSTVKSDVSDAKTDAYNAMQTAEAVENDVFGSGSKKISGTKITDHSISVDQLIVNEAFMDSIATRIFNLQKGGVIKSDNWNGSAMLYPTVKSFPADANKGDYFIFEGNTFFFLSLTEYVYKKGTVSPKFNYLDGPVTDVETSILSDGRMKLHVRYYTAKGGESYTDFYLNIGDSFMVAVSGTYSSNHYMFTGTGLMKLGYSSTTIGQKLVSVTISKSEAIIDKRGSSGFIQLSNGKAEFNDEVYASNMHIGGHSIVDGSISTEDVFLPCVEFEQNVVDDITNFDLNLSTMTAASLKAKLDSIIDSYSSHNVGNDFEHSDARTVFIRITSTDGINPIPYAKSASQLIRYYDVYNNIHYELRNESGDVRYLIQDNEVSDKGKSGFNEFDGLSMKLHFGNIARYFNTCVGELWSTNLIGAKHGYQFGSYARAAEFRSYNVSWDNKHLYLYFLKCEISSAPRLCAVQRTNDVWNVGVVYRKSNGAFIISLGYGLLGTTIEVVNDDDTTVRINDIRL